jgi:glycosyltransferase involved in cell wall biosynthesis
MTTPLPVVTVIIPTYNWSTVLPYSIGSVLRQTFPHFELLVVGDGCTDDSEAVVRTMSDARVRWINLPANTGHQSGPNNEGLRQARGDVIAYLGHDDLWLPHHLSCLLPLIEAGYDLAYGVTETVGPEGSYVEPAGRLTVYQPGMWIPPTGIIHRRRVTDRVGGWRDYRDINSDPEIDLWQRAFQAGHRFAFVGRLTAVKFPAAHRRDVYKLRPHHEQAAWSKRLQNEPHLETLELVRMLMAAQNKVWQARQLTNPAPSMPENGDKVEARRKFKGL